jgi:hypothetical protein
VFTGRYGLIPYITQICFVSKGITSHWIELSGQIHVPTDLAWENSLLFPPYVRICGPQIWSGRFEGERNVQCLPGIASLFLGFRPVALPTETFRLLSTCINYECM